MYLSTLAKSASATRTFSPAHSVAAPGAKTPAATMPRFDMYALASAGPTSSAASSSSGLKAPNSTSRAAVAAPSSSQQPGAFGVPGLHISTPTDLADQFKSGISSGVKVVAITLGSVAALGAVMAGAALVVCAVRRNRARTKSKRDTTPVVSSATTSNASVDLERSSSSAHGS